MSSAQDEGCQHPSPPISAFKVESSRQVVEKRQRFLEAQMSFALSTRDQSISLTVLPMVKYLELTK